MLSQILLIVFVMNINTIISGNQLESDLMLAESAKVGKAVGGVGVGAAKFGKAGAAGAFAKGAGAAGFGAKKFGKKGKLYYYYIDLNVNV
jgi:hypothetical protein